jgi:hypothetical protein
LQHRAGLPLGKTRYPLFRRLGEPQGWYERMRKISHPTGIRSPDRQARSESLHRLSYPDPRSSNVGRSPANKQEVCAPSHRASGPSVLSPGRCSDIMTVITHTVPCFVPFCVLLDIILSVCFILFYAVILISSLIIQLKLVIIWCWV